MNWDLASLLFVVALAGLVVFGHFWTGSLRQHRKLFGAEEVEPAGDFSCLSVYRLHCGQDGPKIGIHLPAPGESGLRLVLDTEAALHLAELLERSADGARAS